MLLALIPAEIKTGCFLISISGAGGSLIVTQKAIMHGSMDH
jgi:hypothetical protein